MALYFLCPIGGQYRSRSFRYALHEQENVKFAVGHILIFSCWKVLGERGPQKPEAYKFNLYTTKKYLQGTQKLKLDTRKSCMYMYN